MKKVTLTVMCRDEDAEHIEREFDDSYITQLGIYSCGAAVEDCTQKEEAEVRSQIPPEVLGEDEHGD